MSSLAQYLEKMRWGSLDALKSVPTNLGYPFIDSRDESESGIPATTAEYMPEGETPFVM